MKLPDRANEDNRETLDAICWRLKRLLARKKGVPAYAVSRLDSQTLLSEVMNFETEFHPHWDALEIECMIMGTFGCPDGELSLKNSFENNRICDIAAAVLEIAGESSIGRVVKRYRIWLKDYQTRVHAISIGDVEKNGRLLQFATDELKSDREAVLAAVKNYGMALAFSTPQVQGDREVVLAAVSNNPLSLMYASAPLIADKGLLTIVLRKWGDRYRLIQRFLGEAKYPLLGKDGEWDYATREWVAACQHAVKTLEGTAYLKVFFMTAIETWADVLVFAPEEIKRDSEIAYRVTRINPSALRHMFVKRS